MCERFLISLVSDFFSLDGEPDSMYLGRRMSVGAGLDDDLS